MVVIALAAFAPAAALLIRRAGSAAGCAWELALLAAWSAVLGAAALVWARRQGLANMELLSLLSHELRSPMTTIHGFLLTIRQRGSQISETKRQEYLQLMEQESRRLVRFVNDLLDVTKIELGYYEMVRLPCDLAQLARSAADQIGRDHPDLTVEALGCSRPIPLELDGAKVSQAVAILLEHAAERSPRGGRLVLELGAREHLLLVRVRDEGRPLDRTPERASLAIARKIVQLHGGDLRVQNHAAGGVEFSFSLPAESAAPTEGR